MTESIKLINFFGSIFTLTAMAIDRFILICKPKVGSYNKSLVENRKDSWIIPPTQYVGG